MSPEGGEKEASSGYLYSARWLFAFWGDEFMNTQDFKRKLTAVFSGDVAGYSRFMGEDEAATVKTLEAYKRVMYGLIKQHRGRVVDSPGEQPSRRVC
jgi:class 3 adenylate cyclase